MTDAATLASRLEAIRKARDSGVLVVTHQGTSTTFRSLAEMERIIASLTADIAAATGTPARRTRYGYIRGGGL